MTTMIDLHRHLEGSIRPSTALDLLRRGQRVSAPSIATRRDWRSAFVAADREGGLLPYLAKIDNATQLVTSLQDWERITHEAIADAVDDGLDALELRFSPAFVHLMTGLDPDAVLETVAGAAANASHAIEVGLIGIVLRNAGPESAVVQIDRFVRHSDDLVGVDLAGDEAHHPAALFAEAFRRAHDHGLAVTIHAGEAAGPESVWAAVEHLKPRRIGHGVRSAEDPRLMDHLAEQGITLEVAITSNVQTGAAPSQEGHQLRRLLDGGVPVALCTDNPSVSNTRLSREYQLAESLLPPEQVQKIRVQSAAARFQ